MSTVSGPQLPEIEADPYGGAHILRWSKTARSLPDSKTRLTTSYSRELSHLDDVDTNSIPYRLPRITPRDEFRPVTDEEAKVFSRFGYEQALRVPELVPVVRMLNPPQTYSQTERQMNLAVPKFQNAAITPTVRQLQWHPVKDSTMEDVQVYKTMIGNMPRQRTNIDYFKPDRPEPTPSPISRTESPAKSVRSIHWMLGSAKHPLFDNKGRTRNQGPFSREFTVTCIAPSNWMKMKWGRARTSVH